MAIKFRRFVALIGLASGFAQVLPALAQQSPPAPQAAPKVPADTANVQATPAQQTEPTFTVFGIRVGLDAPLPPSYEATSFSNLAGQPMTGVDQVMSQQFTGRQP
jgi:hypothetical protein